MVPRLRPTGSVLSPVPGSTDLGNCGWCAEALFLGQAAVTGHHWLLKMHMCVCFVLCR